MEHILLEGLMLHMVTFQFSCPKINEFTFHLKESLLIKIDKPALNRNI